jgi:putative MATE family efflux protein
MTRNPRPAAAAAAAPQTFGRDLTVGSIPRHLIVFSLPLLAGNALQTAYSIVNAIWVGQFIGTEALAAVTDCFPVIFTLIALALGLTMGSGILVSQRYGARDIEGVRRVVATATVIILALGVIITVIGEVFASEILTLMATPDDVLPLAVEYLRIFLLCLPLGFWIFLQRSFLQGVGDSRTPLYFQAAGVLISAVLDPILMFGWLGFPAMGLNGTAWAALPAHVISLGALLWYMRRQKTPVSPVFSLRQFDWRTALSIFSIGGPAAMQQSLVSVSMVVVLGLVNSFGKGAAAAFGAGTRIDGLAFMPAMAFSIAVSTLTGQNIGAGKLDRVRSIFRWGCLLCGGITAIASLLAITAPHLLLRIFTPDPAVIDMGADYLTIVGACYLCFAVMFVANGVINGSGHTLVTTIISLVSLWVVRVPVASWLSGQWGIHDSLNLWLFQLPLPDCLSGRLGVDGIWFAMAASFVISMIASVIYYRTGWWRKPVARTRPIPTTSEAVFGDGAGEG